MEEDYMKAQEKLGLKNGMYVRTEDNGIDRFKYKIKDDSGYYYHYFFEKTSMTNPEYYVKGKPSFNIIDLIEVGDFVNGELVRKIIDDDGYIYLGITKITCIDESSNINGGIDYYPELSKIDIKTILTHEQYEQTAYKVKEV